jgi:hypothetical protein
MTIQGQFLSALQDRIQRNIKVPYVADADHIPLRGKTEENLAEFAALVTEARDRTLYTVDPHFCVPEKAGSPAEKFSTALRAIQQANEAIADVKGPDPYRIEVSIDECPGMTTENELAYLTRELARMKIPLFTIAPAIGFDKKDKDVAPEQTVSFSKLLKTFHTIASDHGLLLGIHSGDGKSPTTLRLIAEATEGQIWYKVSPDRQRLFFKALSEAPPDSEDHRLFAEMLEYLKNAMQQGTWVFYDEVRVNIMKNPVSWEAFYDVGFLLVKPFIHRIRHLGAEFEKRYCELDCRYITDLAGNLGLTTATKS